MQDMWGIHGDSEVRNPVSVQHSAGKDCAYLAQKDCVTFNRQCTRGQNDHFNLQKEEQCYSSPFATDLSS